MGLGCVILRMKKVIRGFPTSCRGRDIPGQDGGPFGLVLPSRYPPTSATLDCGLCSPPACLLGGAVPGPSETVIHRGQLTSWPGGGWAGARYFPACSHSWETFLERHLCQGFLSALDPLLAARPLLSFSLEITQAVYFLTVLLQ